MKKKNLLFLSLLFLVFGLSSCSSQERVVDGNVVSDKVSDIDGFVAPEREAEINGVIKSIDANQIVVAIVERQSGGNAVAITEDGEKTVAIGGTTDTRIPGSGMGGGSNRDSSISDADRLAKLLERSTGQVTITVPVGIAMTKFSEDGDGEKIEATLSDLKSGKMLSVWLNENIEDRKVAEFVSIR